MVQTKHSFGDSSFFVTEHVHIILWDVRRCQEQTYDTRIKGFKQLDRYINLD